MIPVLDFNKLPSDDIFLSRPVLIALPKEIEYRLEAMPQTLERVRTCVMFAEKMSKQNNPIYAGAYLRAALAEYQSIDDMQKFDLPKSAHLPIIKLSNPLLHLLSLMRHLNIHIKTVPTTPHSVNVTYCEHTFNLDTFVVSNLNAVEIAALRNGKYYAADNLEKIVRWFNEAQLHWGAGYLVRIGAETYALALCDHLQALNL